MSGMGEDIYSILALLLGASGDEDTLDHQKDAANFTQDQFDLLSDPYLTLLAGPGSFDPNAFAPTVSGYDEFDIPSNPLEAYMALPDGSQEKSVALGIASGLSPEQIVAEQRSIGVKDEDLERVRGLATELFKGNFDYTTQIRGIPGFSQGEDGQWVYGGDGEIVGNKVRVPQVGESKASQYYSSRGLPSPTDQFTEADFGYGPERAQIMEAAKAELAKLKLNESSYLDAFLGRDNPNTYQGGVPAVAAPQGPNTLPPPGAARPSTEVITLPDDDVLGRLAGRQTAAPTNTLPPINPRPNAQNGPLGGIVDRVGSQSLPKYGPPAPALNHDEWLRRYREEHQAANALGNAQMADTRDQAYAQQMARLHQQNGVTPASLAMLQRAQLLRAFGG